MKNNSRSKHPSFPNIEFRLYITEKNKVIYNSKRKEVAIFHINVIKIKIIWLFWSAGILFCFRWKDYITTEMLLFLDVDDVQYNHILCVLRDDPSSLMMMRGQQTAGAGSMDRTCMDGEDLRWWMWYVVGNAACATGGALVIVTSPMHALSLWNEQKRRLCLVSWLIFSRQSKLAFSKVTYSCLVACII